MNEAVNSLRQERTIFKRQWKILEEDITEDLKPNRTLVEDAYAASIMERVLTGQEKMPNKNLTTRNSAKRLKSTIMDGIPKAHCSFVAWCDSNEVKATHIVPRILKSEELAHLYGVGEVALECPKNGMEFTFCLNETKQLTVAIKSTVFA